MPPETPLGFITGKVTIEGLPTAPTGLQISITATLEGTSKATTAYVQPNPNGSDYAVPLAPGSYIVLAQFGSAQTPPQKVMVENGKPTQVNFPFGK